MTHDGIHERGQALEDKFFRDRDRELLEKLRDQSKDEDLQAALRSSLGISDESVLSELVAHGIRVENAAAISIVPLVAVAWADDIMEDKEIDAVLKACDQIGIKQGQASYELVKSWLAEKPSDELVQTWKDYVVTLKSTLDDTAFSQLHQAVMSRCKDVAAAAGGFLGIGSISGVEKQVMTDLETAFG